MNSKRLTELSKQMLGILHPMGYVISSHVNEPILQHIDSMPYGMPYIKYCPSGIWYLYRNGELCPYDDLRSAYGAMLDHKKGRL